MYVHIRNTGNYSKLRSIDDTKIARNGPFTYYYYTNAWKIM